MKNFAVIHTHINQPTIIKWFATTQQANQYILMARKSAIYGESFTIVSEEEFNSY